MTLEQFLHLHKLIQYRRIFRKTIKAFWAILTQMALEQFQLSSLIQHHQSAQERLKQTHEEMCSITLNEIRKEVCCIRVK
ncbi:hypothetical protein ANANG_G00319790 [Anguilla anguilla]|uniref:Uncharacterized protein n=1 Tax=Anguilla anguilla TaxID=7936 RepID=A0A9D3RJC7_ANGAN|nr:hypothetical protein ANANG_G00319790 [Anguilla anguilla]